MTIFLKVNTPFLAEALRGRMIEFSLMSPYPLLALPPKENVKVAEALS
jgi:hypothetical protein